MIEAATFAGLDDAGGPVFDVNLGIPDPLPNDFPPTARQVAAIQELFGDLGDLTASQAHALLDCRDYGRQCAARLLGRFGPGTRGMFGPMIAAFILADDARTADVVAWGRRRFDSQPDGSAIGRTKRFREVEIWVGERLRDAAAAGARL